ncbi:MAG: tRNA (cytosine(32)/uridine(32)-2'-O)-methyltransferase TrmJ, partial [Gammaproteobacteria bacterium]
TEIAFLFGKEQYGLTNEQLDRCQYLVQIPANPNFSSLNLASAVQLIGYQLRVTLLGASEPPSATEPDTVKPTDLPANNTEFEGMFDHLTATLGKIEFVDLENPGKVLRRIRAVLQRAELSRNETAIIRGICSATVPPDNHNRRDKDEVDV